jgi:hypothetical protein
MTQNSLLKKRKEHKQLKKLKSSEDRKLVIFIYVK